MDEPLRAIDQPLFQRIYREFPWVFKEFIRRALVSADPFLPAPLRYGIAVTELLRRGYLDVGLPSRSTTYSHRTSSEEQSCGRVDGVDGERSRASATDVWVGQLPNRCNYPCNLSVSETGPSDRGREICDELFEEEEASESCSSSDSSTNTYESEPEEEELMVCEEDIDWSRVDEEIALQLARFATNKVQFQKPQLVDGELAQKTSEEKQTISSDFPHVVEREEVVASSDIIAETETRIEEKESEQVDRSSEAPSLSKEGAAAAGSESQLLESEVAAADGYDLASMLESMELVRHQISKIKNLGKREESSERKRWLKVEPNAIPCSRSRPYSYRDRDEKRVRREDGRGDWASTSPEYPPPPQRILRERRLWRLRQRSRRAFVPYNPVQ